MIAEARTKDLFDLRNKSHGIISRTLALIVTNTRKKVINRKLTRLNSTRNLNRRAFVVLSKRIKLVRYFEHITRLQMNIILVMTLTWLFVRQFTNQNLKSLP